MDRMQGKVALVTGAAQGIGRGIATAYAKAGASVVLAGRTAEKVEALENELKALSLSAAAVGCDVSRQEDVKAAIQFAVDTFGGLDVLVNNAGACYNDHQPFEATTTEFFQQGVDTNLLGTFWAMQEALPHLKKTRGFIINVASAAGTNGAAYLAAYAATKEGVRALTRTAAKEWGHFGINVNVICPYAKTPAWEAFEQQRPEEYAQTLREIPLGYLGDCEKDIGPVAVFLATDDSRYITDHTIMVDGGWEVLR